MFKNKIKNIKDVSKNLALIIDAAMSGKHIQEEFIRSIDEFNVASAYRTGLLKILKGFNQAVRHCQRDYIKSVEDGSNIFESLIIYLQFKQCQEFYKTEIKLVSDLMTEYFNYVCAGNIISTLLGVRRPEKDLVKYTKYGRPNDDRR